MVLGVLTASWASGEDSASKMVPKRTPKCSQDGPRGSKEADLGEHGGEVGAKMALCWPSWRPRWPTWRHLGGHLGSFYRFGGALSGAVLGHLGNILRHLSGKISLRAPRERQESAQERKYEKNEGFGSPKTGENRGGRGKSPVGWAGSIPYH